MSAPHNNTSIFPFLNTKNPNFIQIVHRAPISAKLLDYLLCIGILYPTSCYCCNREKLYQRTYAQVHENRVEVNYPFIGRKGAALNAIRGLFGWCGWCDEVEVFYFDDFVAGNIGRAGFCTPSCTHHQCFPTCCDIFGQAVVIYSENCLCRRYVFIPCLEDADAFVAAFNQAKSGAVPGIVQQQVIIQQPMVIQGGYEMRSEDKQ